MQANPRKRRLSLDRIVATAIELADADGLAAVSMRSVAQRLGFTTMSLYRHVASKEELLVLMRDAALGPPQPLALDDGGWRGALERWSRGLVAVLLAHPWALDVPITGPPSTPSQLAWLDSGLQALAGTPLGEIEKAGVILHLNGGAFWEARVTIEMTRSAHANGRTLDAEVAAYGGAIGAAVAAGTLPALRRALDAGLFEDDADDFALGRQLALDGIERLIERRGASPSR